MCEQQTQVNFGISGLNKTVKNLKSDKFSQLNPKMAHANCKPLFKTFKSNQISTAPICSKRKCMFIVHINEHITFSGNNTKPNGLQVLGSDMKRLNA